ncbi:bicaudal-D-related protein 2-like isoform X2 [Channa argus]|uniref:bicaudal-D-related protein 2-like isoform X2 n=1 Tax=Channa argus TaxID=215402 RepID=UPI0035215ACA
MDYSEPFSVLNEKLKPRPTTSEQLYSSLNRLEDKQFGSLRSKSTSCRATFLPEETEPKVTVNIEESEDPEESEDDTNQVDFASNDLEEEAKFADLLPSSTTRLLAELNLKDVAEEDLVEEDSSTSQSEEIDSAGDRAAEGTRTSSESAALAGQGGSPFQRDYIDRTLPDLINSGRTLSRRRTLGHVSATLSEVRREVELSRRRSIRLKAQVDKLQESSDGPGWSHHRERVTEEVLSILRLLQSLTEPESSPPDPSHGENHLDTALSQLKNVARELAISHTKQESKSGDEESSILQQAMRDRDEAIEKKKAMEAELLRSKTDLMLLNNQLLEAVQKRLELALELEAWKDDIQRILQQQLQSQHQAEQAQKKPSRLGILRRHNKPPMQRPPSIPSNLSTPPTTNPNQIFVPRAVAPAPSTPSTSPSTSTQRNWRDKLKRSKASRQGDQEASGQDAECGKNDEGFQVISLD